MCARFSRGWTLQEMLAPLRVIFFTAHWEIIGHKINTEIFRLTGWSTHSQGCPCRERRTTSSLGPHIIPWLVEASSIPEQYLYGAPVNKASIAERMSWASHRKTTRVEDQAYSLLGLFQTNMPLLYPFDASRKRSCAEAMTRRYSAATTTPS